MDFENFEFIISPQRMNRYLLSCLDNTRKSMTLYRYNLKLSQELFTIISCFEIGLRNSIDRHYISMLGNEWLLNSIQYNGIFYPQECKITKKIIERKISAMQTNYSHSNLVSDMDFGFWKYLFAKPQYNAGTKSLLKIFPNKPISSKNTQYNQKYIFKKLESINKLRNRIAHHEPICFEKYKTIINTDYAYNNYKLIKELFSWMDINESELLYGIDHIDQIISNINKVKH